VHAELHILICAPSHLCKLAHLYHPIFW